VDFGDPEAEAVAARDGAVAVPLLGFAVHEVTGADARAFLHRMLSQDVKGLAVGDGRPATFLDVRGRVQGDPVVLATDAGFLLAEEPAAAARVVPGLERYVIADDVRFADVGAAHDVTVLVGAASAAVAAVTRPALRAAGAVAASLGWRSGHATLVVAPVAARVFAALTEAGATPAGEAALDAARVAALAPWFGAELDDRVLPNEAVHDAAVSFTKGCYLGQEPVVMARHRGRPPTTLVRLAVDGRVAPAREAALADGGRRVGRVTTAVVVAGRVVALALVRTDLARAGVALGLEDGRLAVVEAVAT
jgi:folate-binding protein YgfZ